jgi:type 1 glutamine amidotransferase
MPWLLLLTLGTAMVAVAQAPRGAPLRLLVVTGGHDYPTSFYTLFEQPGLSWDHAVGNEEAFKRDLRADYDVLVLYDMSVTLSEAGRHNLQQFAESGKGILVLHHAVVSYQDWPWYRDLVGGRYFERPQGDHRASTYSHDEDMRIHIATPHLITAGVRLTRIHDETYKGMWISPDVTVLLTTDHPKADAPVAWISPYGRSRVVYVQLGHGAEAHRDPGYRLLVRNAIAWVAGRL